MNCVEKIEAVNLLINAVSESTKDPGSFNKAIKESKATERLLKIILGRSPKAKEVLLAQEGGDLSVCCSCCSEQDK